MATVVVMVYFRKTVKLLSGKAVISMFLTCGNGGNAFSNSYALNFLFRTEKRMVMLNMMMIENMPSIQRLEKADKFFYYAMESVRERLAILDNKLIQPKLPFYQLVGGLINVLADNNNFPDSKDEIRELCIWVGSEYLEKGFPEELETKYELLCMKIVLALAEDDRAIDLINEVLTEERCETTVQKYEK